MVHTFFFLLRPERARLILVVGWLLKTRLEIALIQMIPLYSLHQVPKLEQQKILRLIRVLKSLLESLHLMRLGPGDGFGFPVTSHLVQKNCTFSDHASAIGSRHLLHFGKALVTLLRRSVCSAALHYFRATCTESFLGQLTV